ncbi:hypothetical protein KM043_008102 [Ampulex compressa]|nr:hypothetical protein KM043_008102 [Ampulex compressa]
MAEGSLADEFRGEYSEARGRSEGHLFGCSYDSKFLLPYGRATRRLHKPLGRSTKNGRSLQVNGERRAKILTPARLRKPNNRKTSIGHGVFVRYISGEDKSVYGEVNECRGWFAEWAWLIAGLQQLVWAPSSHPSFSIYERGYTTDLRGPGNDQATRVTGISRRYVIFLFQAFWVTSHGPSKDDDSARRAARKARGDLIAGEALQCLIFNRAEDRSSLSLFD